MTTIYLIRHGEAEGNLYRLMHGQYDSRLTELGLRQAEALGARFQNVPLDAVYSSDLCRAMETVAPICREKGLPLYTDPRLREIHMGAWEEVPFGNAAEDEGPTLQTFSQRPLEWHIPGSEDYRALSARGIAALRDIAARHEGQSVAVGAHFVLIKSILGGLFFGLDHPERTPQLRNTCVNRITAENGAFSLDYFNDADHLPLSLQHVPNGRNLCIRPMGESAVEEYIRYRKDAWQVVYGDLQGFDGPGFWLDARRSVGPDPEAMIVAYLDGQPAGMLQLSPDRDARKGVGYIPFVYLRAPYRHQGLGIQLIGHAVRFYRKRGRTRLQLSVYPGNTNALGFYHKYGFSQVKKHRGRFGSLLLMEKDISPPAPPKGVTVIPAGDLARPRD